MPQISCVLTPQLISAFVFATQIVQSLFFLNRKFQASSYLLWLHSPVCVGPGQNPVFSRRASYFSCREQERKVGPDGFLDSNRYSHTYQVKKKDRELKTARSEGGKPSVVKLSAKIEMDKKEHDRRIKVIEVKIVVFLRF